MNQGKIATIYLEKAEDLFRLTGIQNKVEEIGKQDSKSNARK